MKPHSLVLTAAFLMLSAVNAPAADRFVYESKKFQETLTAGRPILVHVTAPWCGECRQQKPIVAALAEEPAYKTLTIVDVDYDSQKEALRELRVQKQSTLVVFKDKVEVGRAVGITRRDAIEAVVRKGL
ncbi:MAG: thiol reductase thioredoxin [Bradyrhizobium sp.]|nr:thiol reductase thioredoxin [Bradyrhizobium sp.]